MSLLELERVDKSFRDGLRINDVLRAVSLAIDPGELVAIWGLRHSGRSTLLRVAAGIEAPDRGSVRFMGRDLARHRQGLLGSGIGDCHTVSAQRRGSWRSSR